MSVVDNNSTRALLPAGGVFQGKTYKPDSKYITAQISFQFFGALTGRLEVYYSLDGVFFDNYGDSWDYVEGHYFKETQLKGNYFYVKFTNTGSSAQTKFDLHTKLTTSVSTVSVDGVINIPEVNVNIDGETVFARIRDSNNNDIIVSSNGLNVYDQATKIVLDGMNGKVPSGLTVVDNELQVNVSGQSLNISNLPAVQDVSGSVSVSNFPATQAVSGTFWQATQPVSGSVSVSNLPTTQAVSGSVAVSNFPATQPVSGSVSVSNLPTTQDISGSVVVSNFPSSQNVKIFDCSGFTLRADPYLGGALQVSVKNEPTVSVSNLPATQNVSGSVSVSNLPATQNVSGSVSVSNFPATQAVSGTFWQATQPVSGSVSVSNQISGYATSALQTQGNNLLTDIKTKTLNSNSDSVMVWAGNDDFKIRNLSATTDNVDVGLSIYSYQNREPPFPASRDVLSTQLVGVDDLSGSNLINLVSNTNGHLVVEVDNFPATTEVSNFPTSFEVSNFPATQAVSGTFWQATQPVSGSVSVSNLPSVQNVSGSVSVSNFPATQAVSGTFWQATQPVSGSVSVSNLPSVQDVSGSVAVSNFPTTQAVSGTFWQATQPVSGTLDSHMYASSNGSTWHHLSSDSNGQLNVHSKLQDGAGNDLTSKAISSSRALDVNIINNTDAVIVDLLNPTIGVQGTVSVNNFPSTTSISGDVNITNSSLAITGNVNATIVNGSAIPVSGTFYQATQPVSLASNVGIKDSSGNSIKVDASNNLLVNVASGSITVSSVNIKDSSGNSLTSTSNNLDTNMKCYNRTNASTATLSSVQPVGASSSVKALETYSYIVGLDNGSNIPLQLTSTQGAYQNSLDTYINNGSTTNFNSASGLNVYQILPKTKTYTFGGYDSNATANGLIIGNATAGQAVSSSSFNFGGSMTFYAVLGASGTKNIIFDYVDSSGNFATSASTGINGTTATSLGTFRSILDFRLDSTVASGDALYIGTSSTVATLKQTSLYGEDINQKLIGAITIPSGYIGYITNLTSLVASATGIQLNRWNTAGVRSAVWRVNNTGNIYINSGYEGTIGGVFTAGDTLVYSGQSAVTGKSIIANLVLKSIL